MHGFRYTVNVYCDVLADVRVYTCTICRRKESSRSLSHLLMSFLLLMLRFYDRFYNSLLKVFFLNMWLMVPRNLWGLAKFHLGIVFALETILSGWNF